MPNPPQRDAEFYQPELTLIMAYVLNANRSRNQSLTFKKKELIFSCGTVTFEEIAPFVSAMCGYTVEFASWDTSAMHDDAHIEEFMIIKWSS